MLDEFLMTLKMIEKHDADIDSEERYNYIIRAMALANQLGYKTNIAINFGRPMLCIELPTGRVYWRLSTTPIYVMYLSAKEKYDRIHRFAESYQ